MSWVVILFIVALVISPVMWLRPSPKQRRVAALRQAAAKAGVKVKLAAPPLHAAGKAMPSYQWLYPQERPGPRFVLVRDGVASPALKTFRPGWRWRIEPLRALPDEAEKRLVELLSRLPQDAVVIESDRPALVLWWYESQGAERFSTYLDDFVQLREGLAGRPDVP